MQTGSLADVESNRLSIIYCPAVTKFFNVSISTGIFPTNLKLSSIVHVHVPKCQSNKGNPKNYCPISLLPIGNKLLEKHTEHIHESIWVPAGKTDHYTALQS